MTWKKIPEEAVPVKACGRCGAIRRMDQLMPYLNLLVCRNWSSCNYRRHQRERN